MSKDYLIALGGGAASALASFAFLSGMGGALVFAYLSLFPIFAVGFGWGVRHGYIALLFGLFLAFALGGLMAGGVYALATTVPGAIIIRQAVLGKRLDNGDIYWYPLGHILCTLAAAGAAAIALLALANLNADDGFQGMLAGFLDQVLQARFGASQRFDTAALSASLIPLLPAAIVSSWLLMATLNAIAAQGLLTRLRKNRRPEPQYSSLEMPEWASWALVAAAAVALLSSGDLEFLARNLTMILATPFFFAGLGTAHQLVRRLGAPGMALAALYVVLLFSSWAAIAVAGLGIADQWTDLRRRYAPQQGPADEEKE